MDTPWRRLVDRWQGWRGYEWRVDLHYREGDAVAYLRSIEPESIAFACLNLHPDWTLIGWCVTSI